MAIPDAKVVIELFIHDLPKVVLVKIDPMQAAQACATAAAQIILGQRTKAGQAKEGNIIQVPGLMLENTKF